MPAPLSRLIHPVNISPFAPSTTPPQNEPSPSPTLSIAPYRRAPKACAHCRSGKTRCGMARPCSGCVQKGRAHLCVDACVACRKARLRCDGNQPCDSCVQDGRVCVEDDPSAIAAARLRSQRPRPLAASPPTPPTPRIAPPPTTLSMTPDLTPPANGAPNFDAPAPATTARSRRAAADARTCLSCRRDLVSCAGGHPCPRCAGRNERCVYVVRAPKLTKQRCALCRKKNKKCQEARPCRLCAAAGVECVDVPRKGTGSGHRVKRACAGCREDKIQCEEVRPCAGCKKKKIPCVARECRACIKKGERCSSCVRDDRLRAETAASSPPPLDEDSDSDWDGLPTPSTQVGPSSAFLLGPRAGEKEVPLPPFLNGPSPFSPGPSVHSHHSFHDHGPTHGNSSLFSFEGASSFSLETCLSDIRTRPAHFGDE